MPIEFDAKLEAKDMFLFNMYQTYTSLNGWMTIILSILLFVMAFYYYGEVAPSRIVLYVAVGILMLVYMPFNLWMRSKQSIKTSPVLGNELHYQIDEDGFTVTQGEASGVLAWKQVYKMVATKSLVLVYSNRVHAYVIPRNQLGENYIPLAKLATAQLPKFRVKMKVTIKDV